jgi:hypothetical protein
MVMVEGVVFGVRGVEAIEVVTKALVDVCGICMYCLQKMAGQRGCIARKDIGEVMVAVDALD